VTDIEIQANEIIKTRETLNEILAGHTGKTPDEILKACDRDNYLTAEEAKEFGLVDDILTKPPGSEDDEDGDD
ncbi:MAG: ATP-dependent Clp protease proteolytic subunit, partial [Planctomycetota bacterium]